MRTGTSSRLRLGIVGAGSAAVAHAEVIQSLGCDIAAVCARPASPRVEGFASRFSVPRIYDDVEDMLAGQTVDGLVVATSWDQTEAVMRKVVGRGVPCLVEKPVALSAGGAETIWKLAGGDSAPIQVGYNRRFYEFMPRLRERLAVEAPLSIDLQCPEAVEPLVIAHGEQILPHVLVYMTSHWLDLVSHLVGDLAILHMHRTPDPSGRYVVSYDGLLRAIRFEIPIHLMAHFGTPSRTALTITFRDQIWRLCPIERLTIFDGLIRHEPTDQVPYRRYEPRVKETAEVDRRFKPGFAVQMQEFLRLVTNSPEPRVGCSLGEAVRVTRLCEQIQGRA